MIALAVDGLCSRGKEYFFLNARSKLIGLEMSKLIGLTIELDVSESSSCDSDPTSSPAAELELDSNCSETVF